MIDARMGRERHCYVVTATMAAIISTNSIIAATIRVAKATRCVTDANATTRSVSVRMSSVTTGTTAFA